MRRLTDLSLLQAAAGLRAGEFSARLLAQAYLDRIAALDPSLHAYLTLTPELAMAQADAADHRLAQADRSHGDSLPLLLGLPLALKDVLCLEGVPTTCGSRILEGFRPPYTATAVQRLLDQGAVILGKVNTDEFAMGSSTENSAFGVTHNPWNLERVPGGSSPPSVA
jgi:aspartyl-tRNA(Asn)/glutamyl-tRNA(Gln) amidotransferase subunit A